MPVDWAALPVTPQEDEAFEERFPAQCVFGDGAACAVVELSDGCVARRHDRRQGLCPQHLLDAEPLGDMRVVATWGSMTGGYPSLGG